MPSWIHSSAAYYRFKAVSVVPEGISKVLYLDVDMLVLCDLRELFAMDFRGKMLIRTGDACYSNDWRSAKSLRKNLKDYVYSEPRGAYFNSAFMLINAHKWRALDIEKKLFEFAHDYEVGCGDQDVLNFVIKSDTIKLGEKWDFFVGAWIMDRFGAHNPFMGESANPYWPFSRQEMSEFEKDMKIVHFTHWCVKPWQSYYHSLDAAYKPVKYPYYDTWWHFALSTPIFNDELKALQSELKEKELLDYATTLSSKLMQRDNEVKHLKKQLLTLIDPKLESAVVRIKNQLSYRLGKAIVANSKNFKGYLKLPFALLNAFLIYKKKQRVYKARFSYNPNLKLPPLETYADFKEALKVKEYLSYKLGQAFLKGLKTSYKGGLIKFYFEAKKLEKEFKASKNET